MRNDCAKIFKGLLAAAALKNKWTNFTSMSMEVFSFVTASF